MNVPWRIVSTESLAGSLGVTIWFDYTHHLGFADIARFSPVLHRRAHTLSLTCSFTLPRALLIWGDFNIKVNLIQLLGKAG